jgi:hypothetical protein
LKFGGGVFEVFEFEMGNYFERHPAKERGLG